MNVISPRDLVSASSPAGSLEILYEDAHVIVVCKPARLLTARDDSADETLLSRVRDYNAQKQAPGKKGYLVPLHFLDRPVSGAVMFARSSKAASRLSEDFRTRHIEKIYWAVVEGPVSFESEILEDWLVKDRDSNVVTVASPGSKDAKSCRLSWRALAPMGDLTLVEVRPHTGRSHQIRVQLASRGRPIVGDRKYGSATSWDGAIALHARQVQFTHPVGKDRKIVTAPLPARWREEWPKVDYVQKA